MSEVLYLPDLGETYMNPVLFSDYSDPDCICVDGVYWLTASSFNYTPGLPILRSTDLVNWTLVAYALRQLPDARFDAPCHAQGVWAPSIRHHNGRFVIFFGMPDEGIYSVSADDPAGEWDEPVLVKAGRGLIDPCPFWDADGRGWVVHAYAKSRAGFNSRLAIFPLSADGRAAGESALLFDGTEHHPTIEGPKVYCRDGWYYVFAPAGGVEEGWQTVLRSRSLAGPWEDRIVLAQGDTDINGPHQGAWVETPAGESWFLHFQSRGLYGRVVHLQPMRWEDGWPVIGDEGEPVDMWEKPAATEGDPTGIAGSDDFSGPLGLQWQFTANPKLDSYECGEGRLRLLVRSQSGSKLWDCPQVCTQKIACPAFCAQVTLDASGLGAGAQAGFGLLGGQYAYAALRRKGGELSLLYVTSSGDNHEEQITDEIIGLPEAPVTLRMTLLPLGDAEAVMTLEYAVDGVFRVIGQPFRPSRHTWVGARLALFAMPLDGEAAQGGYADFGSFEIEAIETL